MRSRKLQKIQRVDKIISWDQQLFLWFNGFHTDWLDPVIYLVTKTQFWIPFYLFLAYLIFKNYKKEGWLILVGAGLAILLSDRITTGLMKPFFSRLRPSHDPDLQPLTHIVNNYRGGMYGFASSHAANTFAIAMLMWLVFKEIYRWIRWIFVWAVVVAYTRIYLGVHYPGDILGGMLIGSLSAWVGFRFYLWLKSMIDKRNAPVNPA